MSQTSPLSRIALCLALLGATCVAAEDSPAESWIPLFNGKDLAGWTVKITGRDLNDNYRDTFRVEDGILKVSYDQYPEFDGEFGHLFYKERFSRYRLRVEYRFVGEQCPGGPDWALRNSGVMIHSQSAESMEKDQEFPISLEIQFLGGDGENERPTANLCTPGTLAVIDGQLFTEHCTNSRSKTYHGDQWLTVEVEVRGSSAVRAAIDGESVLHFEKPLLEPGAQEFLGRSEPVLSTGFIALQAESHPVEFRKVEILPLPEMAAEIFGSGILSTAAPEFATSMTADAATVYFNRAADDRSSVAILAARRADGGWSEPEALPFSGTYFDVDPFVTADGSRLFFSSNRPGAGEDEPGDFDLWVVERGESGEWGEPQNLGTPVNTDAAEIYSTLSANGNLYFSSDRTGERFLYVSRLADGNYGEPERLTLGNETKSGGGNPAIAPDESFLVFARDAGYGASDLYVSFHRDGAWTAPRSLGEPVSSPFADFAPHISWDGAHLFWTSERPGIVPAGGVEGRPPGDLYRIEWAAAVPEP